MLVFGEVLYSNLTSRYRGKNSQNRVENHQIHDKDFSSQFALLKAND